MAAETWDVFRPWTLRHVARAARISKLPRGLVPFREASSGGPDRTYLAGRFRVGSLSVPSSAGLNGSTLVTASMFSGP